MFVACLRRVYQHHTPSSIDIGSELRCFPVGVTCLVALSVDPASIYTNLSTTSGCENWYVYGLYKARLPSKIHIVFH
jgi:hypothetical protein